MVNWTDPDCDASGKRIHKPKSLAKHPKVKKMPIPDFAKKRNRGHKPTRSVTFGGRTIGKYLDD